MPNLTLRPIGKADYAVIDGERTNNIWMWNVTIPIPGGVPYGTAPDLDPAKAAFREEIGRAHV